MENYKLFRIIITIFVASVVGLSVSLGAIIPAFLAIIIGVLLSYIYKKNTDEVMYDERIVKISEKSSRMAMTLFAISIAIIGLFLITLKDVFPDFTQAGFTLSFAAVALLALYNIFYSYYNSKY
jgi:uncharacterized membrane protein